MVGFVLCICSYVGGEYQIWKRYPKDSELFQKVETCYSSDRGLRLGSDIRWLTKKENSLFGREMGFISGPVECAVPVISRKWLERSCLILQANCKICVMVYLL